MDVVKWDQDVRATDISSGEKEYGCSSSPSHRKKREDNTVMGEKKKPGFFHEDTQLAYLR